MPDPSEIIRLHLQVVVPLLVDAWRRGERPIPSDEERSALVDVLTAHGDDLMFGGRHCRDALNALTQLVAFASLVPGGVRVFGTSFDYSIKEASDAS